MPNNPKDWVAIQSYLNKTNSVKDTITHFALSKATWYKAKKRKALIYPEKCLPHKHFTVDHLLEKRNTARSHLKSRLIAEGLLDDSKCGICHNPPIWNGQKLVLQLD